VGGGGGRRQPREGKAGGGVGVRLIAARLMTSSVFSGQKLELLFLGKVICGLVSTFLFDHFWGGFPLGCGDLGHDSSWHLLYEWRLRALIRVPISLWSWEMGWRSLVKNY
jgi:hypothetical protein